MPFPICKLHYAYVNTIVKAHVALHISFITDPADARCIQMLQRSGTSITKISESLGFISINVCWQSTLPKLRIALYVGISGLKSYFRQTHALSQDSLDSSCKEKITNEFQPHEGPDLHRRSRCREWNMFAMQSGSARKQHFLTKQQKAFSQGSL